MVGPRTAALVHIQQEADMAWFLLGLVWFLGACAILMLEHSYSRYRYHFSTKLLVLVCWPFMVVFAMLFWLIQVLYSRRVY